MRNFNNNNNNDNNNNNNNNHSSRNWSVGNDTNSVKRQLEGNWNSCKDIANPEISVIGNSKNFEEGS